MHTPQHTISSGQLFTLLFVSRAASAILVSDRTLGGQNPLEAVFSCVLALAVGFLLALPAFALQKRGAQSALLHPRSKWARLIPAAYIAYFVLSNGAMLGLFEIFLQDTANPDFSAGVTVVLLTCAAVYGACRGLECVARCAGCVFAFMILGAGLVFAIVSIRFDSANLRPLFYDGSAQTIRGTMLFLSRSSVFPELAVLLPKVNRAGKSLVRGYWGWGLGVFAFFSLLFLLLAGCLGPYASTQNFPVFTLTTLTEVRSMQRLDAVFTGVWFMAMVIRISLGLALCRECALALGVKKHPAAAVIWAAGGTLVLTLLAAASRGARAVLLAPLPHLIGVLLLGCALPLVTLLTRKNHSKSKGGSAHGPKGPA